MNLTDSVIYAEAPNRIDLAGGTTDIYPLYLFLEGGITVNAAISILSKVWVTPSLNKETSIYSKDLKKSLKAKSPKELPIGNQLELLVRIVRHYIPEGGVKVVTQNDAPKGSGLGASSALLVALSGALNKISKNKVVLRQIMEVGANLEAQAIRTPTGKQDYIAALYGGIQAIYFGVDGITPLRIVLSKKFLSLLESSMILAFTGIPHFSGSPNWEMMKRFLDKDKKTIKHLSAIKEIAGLMVKALKNENLSLVAKLLEKEWSHRKELASSVTTPLIDEIMKNARKKGALASKLCGAGGGGTMITIAEPGSEEMVKEALEKNGAKILNYKFETSGLKMKDGIQAKNVFD